MDIFSSFHQWLSEHWVFFTLWVVATSWFPVRYYVKRRDILPRYTLRSDNLIQGAISKSRNLKLNYHGISGELENFSVASITFWNAGRGTIHKNDIASADILRIEAKNGCKLLEANIIQANNNDNQFNCTIDPGNNYAVINFEYVGHKDKVEIEVLHTGLTVNDIEVRGTFIGTKNFKNCTTTSKSFTKTWDRRILHCQP